MTAATRQALREAIDLAVRARFDWLAEDRCRGCAVELSDPWSELPRYVDGCATCKERRYRRGVRATVRPFEQLALELAR